jgi:hypothetical protein
VHVNAWRLGKPLLHYRMLVGRVVVGDQVKRLALGRFAINLSQELQPLGVPILALTDDLAVQIVQRGKQRGRAVALVVVRHRLGATLLQRQARLRAIQRLDLALLVAAQHDGVLWRGHVQVDDVFEFLDEQRIARDLEAAHQVRLQAIGLPMAHHRTGTDLQDSSHLARAPVCGGLGLGLCC